MNLCGLLLRDHPFGPLYVIIMTSVRPNSFRCVTFSHV